MSDDWYEDMKKRDAERDKRKAMCGDVPAPVSTYEEKAAYASKKIPKETKQKVLDMWHKGGITVGEIMKECGLDHTEFGQIIKENTLTHEYLSKKVVE